MAAYEALSQEQNVRKRKSNGPRTAAPGHTAPYISTLASVWPVDGGLRRNGAWPSRRIFHPPPCGMHQRGNWEVGQHRAAGQATNTTGSIRNVTFTSPRNLVEAMQNAPCLLWLSAPNMKKPPPTGSTFGWNRKSWCGLCILATKSNPLRL